jgi:hypothetical protein
MSKLIKISLNSLFDSKPVTCHLLSDKLPNMKNRHIQIGESRIYHEAIDINQAIRKNDAIHSLPMFLSWNHHKTFSRIEHISTANIQSFLLEMTMWKSNTETAK